MGDEIKFLKSTIEFDILLSTTREAVELFFEGNGIPAKYDEEVNKRSMYCTPYSTLIIHNKHQYLIMKRVKRSGNRV